MAVSSSVARVTAFCGLGAMGYPMAGHLAKKSKSRCVVWNRTEAKAERHSLEFGSVVARNGFHDLTKASVVVLCLPTTAEDAEVAESLAPQLARGSCIMSCTSGESSQTQSLASSLLDRYGVHFVDAPVSGGPAGAEAATLTCMLGADNEEAAKSCDAVARTFSQHVVRTGPVGSGQAVKSINNILNTAHLLLASEGLLALQRFGVCPEVALSVINSSSGRSLQTQARLPKEVLTREFGYGFKLPLMAKDVRYAEKLLKAEFPQAQILPAVAKLLHEAAASLPEDADYTRAVCFLEQQAGLELRPREVDREKRSS